LRKQKGDEFMKKWLKNVVSVALGAVMVMGLAVPVMASEQVIPAVLAPSVTVEISEIPGLEITFTNAFGIVRFDGWAAVGFSVRAESIVFSMDVQNDSATIPAGTSFTPPDAGFTDVNVGDVFLRFWRLGEDSNIVRRDSAYYILDAFGLTSGPVYLLTDSPITRDASAVTPPVITDLWVSSQGVEVSNVVSVSETTVEQWTVPVIHATANATVAVREQMMAFRIDQIEALPDPADPHSWTFVGATQRESGELLGPIDHEEDFRFTAGTTFVLGEGVYRIDEFIGWGVPWFFIIVTGEATQQPTEPTTPDGAAPNLNSASDWAHESINRAFAHGLIPQSLQNNYIANATRAEFAAFAVALYEAATGREIAGRVEFNDTDDMNVQKMGYLEVVGGVGGGNFAPNDGLTREQAAVMIARLAYAIGQPLPAAGPTFADNAAISSWAVDAVGQVQAAGIMGGVGDNQFAPGGDYTREQSIITMLRLFEILQ